MLPVAKWVLWVFGAQAISLLPWVNIMVGAKQKKSAQPVDVLPHLSVHRSERTGQSLGITPQTIANVQAEQGHYIFILNTRSCPQVQGMDRGPWPSQGCLWLFEGPCTCIYQKVLPGTPRKHHYPVKPSFFEPCLILPIKTSATW